VTLTQYRSSPGRFDSTWEIDTIGVADLISMTK
jgi:hypothetical protein